MVSDNTCVETLRTAHKEGARFCGAKITLGSVFVQPHSGADRSCSHQRDTPLGWRRHEGSGTSLDSVIYCRESSRTRNSGRFCATSTIKFACAFSSRECKAARRLRCLPGKVRVEMDCGRFWAYCDVLDRSRCVYYAVLIVNLSIALIQKREAGFRRSCIVSVTARFNFVLEPVDGARGPTRSSGTEASRR